MKQHYFWGLVAVGLLYVISGFVTRKRAKLLPNIFNFNPLALAVGVDFNHSVSLLQNLIFTYVTLFAYITVYAIARIVDGIDTLPGIPISLLVLMGLNVATATASKGIVVAYNESEKPPPVADRSDVVRDKEGNVALTKVQMLIWTFISAAIYVHTLFLFVEKGLYKTLVDGKTIGGTALPDIDGALLVLMGVSQGAYIGGKLVSQKTGAAIIDRITPSPISLKNGFRVVLHGGLFGSMPDGNTVFIRDKVTGKEQEVPKIPPAQWTDTKVEFDIPPDMQTPGIYIISVNARGLLSREVEIKVEA